MENNEIMNNVEEVAEDVIEVVADNGDSVLKVIAKVGVGAVVVGLLAYGVTKGIKFIKNKRDIKNNEIKAEYKVVEEDVSKEETK